MHKLAVIGVTMGGLMAVPEARADGCPAEGLVKGIATTFDYAARNRSPKAFASATAHFTDIRGLAMFALGQYRPKLSAADEGRYITLTRNFLGRWMAENASRISGAGFTITSCSDQVVTARNANGANFQFRLIGPRRVADITVSGISLSGVLRSKFTDVIRNNNGDISALMSYLAS